MGRSRAPLTGADLDGLDWAKANGLIPAVVQDAATGQVLMLAWCDRAALAETLAEGWATFWSRSRNARWRKGETSGNGLRVVDVLGDCDGDALLMRVEPLGPACHEGTTSCFGAQDAPGLGFLGALERTVAARAASGEGYTGRLLADGVRRCAQKVGEEGVETALAGASGGVEELAEEGADLVYHLVVLLRARGMGLEDVVAVLRRRAGV